MEQSDNPRGPRKGQKAKLGMDWQAGPRGFLTRLHGPPDNAQDIGRIPEFQPVVNSDIHLTLEERER